MAKKGFTLVELLVVIAIIVLLLGILLPVLGSLQRKAQDAKCMSNLKQIFAALHLYGMQYDGLLPAATSAEPEDGGGERWGSWLNGLRTDKLGAPEEGALYKQLGGIPPDEYEGSEDDRPKVIDAIYVCPLDSGPMDSDGLVIGEPKFSYTMNYRLSKRRLASITKQSRIVLMIDEDSEDIVTNADGYELGSFAGTDRPGLRHGNDNDSAMVLYADGHAEPRAFDRDDDGQAIIHADDDDYFSLRPEK